jgi:GGDEF domain-containing protein
MRVFEYVFKDSAVFRSEIELLKEWCNHHNVSNVLMHIYATSYDDPAIGTVIQTISTVIPRALYVGCSTSGNIIGGELSGPGVAVTATVFEDNDTTVEIHQYSFTEESQADVIDKVVEKVNGNPDIKALEFLVTIEDMSMTKLCEGLSKIREEVNIYGGGALNEEMDESKVCVFSKVGDITGYSIVFILYGGKNLTSDAFYIEGWNPLGHKLKITRSVKNRLYELDGKPAYDTYYNYLSIKNDENFFINSLGFPLMMDINGVKILRAPTACNNDGSLQMTADVIENAVVNLSYGDPWTILRSVNEMGLRVQDFGPQSIRIFSCAARRAFWDSSSKETKAFTSVAPATGLYTSGEFVRTGDNINQHNVTMVISMMREGSVIRDPDRLFHMEDSAALSGQVSMVNRLANFLDKATKELEEANNRLSIMAVTDGLSKLFNRGEIQRKISNEVMSAVTSGNDDNLPSLIMIDIDNFKSVNDCCGHSEGDRVIRGLGAMIRDVLKKRAPGGDLRKWDYSDIIEGHADQGPSAGRWGGEEFMILLPKTDINKAIEIAEFMRIEFNNINFPQAASQTISLGVARAVRGENVDAFCARVDSALYEAKRSGKNRVVSK